MRKLVYLLAAVPLLGKLEAASACTFGFFTYEQHLAKASTAFIGRILRTEEAGTMRESDDSSPEPAVEGTFRVVGVLKGEPPADGKVRASASMHCNVPLRAGQDYAIFLYGDNLIRRDGGTTHLWHPESVDAKHLLDQLQEQGKEARKRSKEQLLIQHKMLVEGMTSECYTTLSDEQAFAKASTVFMGHLTRTDEIEAARTGDAPRMQGVEATFQVLDVLKGQPPAEIKVRGTAVSKACLPFLVDVDLLPSNDFVVFLDKDNFIRGGTRGLAFVGGKYAYFTRFRAKLRGLSGKAQ